MIKKLFYFLNGCFIIILAGCWDMEPIEDRGFIIGTAIDLANEDNKETYELTITNQFVLPIGLGSPTQSDGSDQKAYMNISATGDSMLAIDEDMTTSTSKLPFFEHLKILVVSDEVAKIPHLFVDLLNTFIRPDMRRGIEILIAEGEAKKVLDINPKEQKLPAIYLTMMLSNSSKRTGELMSQSLGEINEHHLNRDSYVIPIVRPSIDKVRFQAGAVFNGIEEKLVGTLNKDEMMGLHLITGKTKGGTIEVVYEDVLMTLDIDDAKNKIKMNTKDPENIQINVQIDVNGNIKEVFGSESLKSSQKLAELEKQMSIKIEKLANDVIEKAQGELNTDFFGFSNILKKHHYELWGKVKEDWDYGESYFSKSKIHVTANTMIHQTGISE